MTRPVTNIMIQQQFVRVARMMNDDLRLGVPTLHLGNSTHNIHNRLILGRTNLWPDGMAGTTKREAYNALRIMAATLGATIDQQQDMRQARARTGL